MAAISDATLVARPVNEDEIDDLLYFARTNDAEALDLKLSRIAEANGISERDVISTTIQPNSSSSILHMAAGKGNTGTYLAWL